MILTVQLYKHANKPSVLKCIRTDQSITWFKLQCNTERHDLAHIAVEKTLEFKNSFYGLIAQGIDIGDFELPEHKKPSSLKGINLPKESLITEHLVNLFTIEHFNAKRNINFLKETQNILKENNLQFPENLTEKTLITIRTKFSNLMSQWKNLKDGDYLVNTLNI